MTEIIKPSIGRVVYYRDPELTEPQAATIAYVHSDTMVNLSVVNHSGTQFGETSVQLVQPGEPKPEGIGFCHWMPYQVKKMTGSESGEKAAGTQGI